MSDSTTAGVVATLQGQLDKPPEDSKKFKLLMRGLYGIILVFLVGSVMLMIKPDLATPIASLTTMTVLGIGGVVSVGCGSIAAVDFKNSGSLAQVVQANITK